MKHHNGKTVDLDDIMIYLDHALTALRVMQDGSLGMNAEYAKEHVNELLNEWDDLSDLSFIVSDYAWQAKEALKDIVLGREAINIACLKIEETAEVKIVGNSKYSEVRTAEDKRFLELISAASPEILLLVESVLDGSISPEEGILLSEVYKLQQRNALQGA